MIKNPIYKTLIFYILLFQVLAPQSIPAESIKTRIGFWVPCEGSNQTLASPDKIIQLLQFAQRMGITDIFLQVYRRNTAWYRSKLADSQPFKDIYQSQKIDTLDFAIKEAHRRGIRIHAWFNVFWIGKDLNVTIVKKFGKDIITRDQKGRSMADYPNNLIPGQEGKWFSYGEDGYWLEPGDPRVQNYLLEIFQEVLQNYSDLDGLHLDFVRYPFANPYFPGSYYALTRGIEFGYGTKSVALFTQKMHLNPLKMERTVENHALWDQWRRDQISDLLTKLHQILKKKFSQTRLSCAVLPWPERSYFCSFQDWTRWVQGDEVDFVVTMNYSLDLHLSQFLSRMALGAGKPGHVWIGLGPYLFQKDSNRFASQMKSTLAMAPPGIVLFSYDALLEQKEVVQSLQKVLHSKN